MDDRLRELGIELGSSPPPTARYTRFVRDGDVVYLSGHGPMDERGDLLFVGRVGTELSLDEGREAARAAAVGCLATLEEAADGLSNVKQILKVLGFVNCGGEFNQTSQVMDSASELFEDVFGESGVHARSAIGTTVLPSNMPVEIEMIVRLGPR